MKSSEVLSDGENSESQGENSSEPMRKRGRKPKEPIKAEDRYVPNTDSSKRGIQLLISLLISLLIINSIINNIID
jgi:hypothetical protein